MDTPAPPPPSPTDAPLSEVVAGAWRLAGWGWSPGQRLRWIGQCVDLGVTSFDHADLYGDYRVESLFGEALALAPALRERLQLVTKCGIRLVSAQRPQHRLKSYDTSRAHLLASVEQSLRALRTDRIDLLLIHRPDPLMDAVEIAEAITTLQRDGKVLRFGVSNFTPSQFELLDAVLPLATNQVECHPLHLAPLHDGTLDQAQRLRRRPMIWSPLAGGRLFAPHDERSHAVHRVLHELATAYRVAPATIAHAWLRRHPSRPRAVTGSGRIDALREALAALPLVLEREHWFALWQAGAGHEVP